MQCYGTAIQPVPFNEALCEKGTCCIITKTDSKRQEHCVAELPAVLPKVTYVLLLKSGCFAKTFEFQPSLEQGRYFWGPAWFGHLWPKQTQNPSFPHPSLNSALCLLFYKTLRRVWFCSSRFLNPTGRAKCGCHDLPMQVQRALLWMFSVKFWLICLTSGFSSSISSWKRLCCHWFFFFFCCLSQLDVSSIVRWHKGFTFCVDAMKILKNDPPNQCF